MWGAAIGEVIWHTRRRDVLLFNTLILDILILDTLILHT